GASVLLNDINDTLAAKAVDEINTEFSGCVGFAGDASDPLFISQMVDAAVAKFGKLTIAIANAGITLFGDFLTYQPDDFYKVLHTNLGGTFFLAQAAAQQIKKQGSGGSLLFMSSVTGHQAHKNLAAYSMTKAAIEMLAKNLVIEVSAYGINVNGIAPGATLTERTKEEEDYEAIWKRITPMQRPATPRDIADTALFLVSAGARHITGQTIIIDGGWSCVSPSPYDR
ncbi:MAG TPA: SDR family oxidoreductase, partial [Flavisolibacter sp.]|nr:SDR family oxidoreductase [Flavisolibacter sp.]